MEVGDVRAGPYHHVGRHTQGTGDSMRGEKGSARQAPLPAQTLFLPEIEGGWLERRQEREQDRSRS